MQLDELKQVFPEVATNVLIYAINKAKEDILNYTHLLVVPDGLASTWLAMAVENVNMFLSYATDLTDEDNLVGDVKMGDTSYEKANRLDIFKYFQGLPSLANKYKSSLNRYRRLL